MLKIAEAYCKIAYLKHVSALTLRKTWRRIGRVVIMS